MPTPIVRAALQTGLAAALLVAPFGAPSHLGEKLAMLRAGTLSRPLDVVDLALHGLVPLILLGDAARRLLATRSGS